MAKAPTKTPVSQPRKPMHKKPTRKRTATSRKSPQAQRTQKKKRSKRFTQKRSTQKRFTQKRSTQKPFTQKPSPQKRSTQKRSTQKPSSQKPSTQKRSTVKKSKRSTVEKKTRTRTVRRQTRLSLSRVSAKGGSLAKSLSSKKSANIELWANRPCQNIKCEVAWQGQRPTMEDEEFAGCPASSWQVYAIYDGHGGKGVATKLKKELGPSLLKGLAQVSGSDSARVMSEIRKQFRLAEERISRSTELINQGSCAIVMLRNKENVYVANLGDSRCILFDKSGKVFFESRDQKPTNRDEAFRIVDAGGKVKQGRVNGNLSTARAFGDYGDWAKVKVKGPNGKTPLSSDPVISHVPNVAPSSARPFQALLTCDGIFEPQKMTTRKAVDTVLGRGKQQEHFVHQKNTKPANVCVNLARVALDLGSEDNLSVVLVSLN